LINPPALPFINQQSWALKNCEHLLLNAREQALCLMMPSDAMDIADFSAVLSAKEVQRMRKFQFHDDQRQYAAAHWLKRTAVGTLTGQAPNTLDFSLGSYGKPSLQTHKLNFNLSHSNGFVALLLNRYGDVGVDVEFPQAGMDFNLLLPFVAHPQEYRRISTSDDFYRLWTLKEAICKACGKGLSLAPQTFELSACDAGGFVALCDHEKWLAISHSLPGGGYLACAFGSKPNDLSIVHLS
jgi:4'-phosphopantetheinyl transferase